MKIAIKCSDGNVESGKWIKLRNIKIIFMSKTVFALSLKLKFFSKKKDQNI
jgi:hypothetical protein